MDGGSVCAVVLLFLFELSNYVTRRAALLLFVLYVTTAFVLTHLPGSSVPRVSWSASIPGLDKIVHAGLYFFMAATLANCLRFRLRSNRVVAGITMVVLAGYAAFDEWSQQFSTHRSPDFFDFIADMVGAWIGVSLFSILRWLRRRMRTNCATGLPLASNGPLDNLDIAPEGTTRFIASQSSFVEVPNEGCVKAHTTV